jgi:hypothetical protein
MADDGSYSSVSRSTQIGSIDHKANALMVRPAGTLAVDEFGPATVSMTANSHAPAPQLPNDPETNDPNLTRVLFKIDQRDQEVRLVFTKKQKVEDARTRIAALVGVDPAAISLLFGGKALKEQFILDRLRVGEQGISIYIKDDAEVLLVTAKAYRRPT